MQKHANKFANYEVLKIWLLFYFQFVLHPIIFYVGDTTFEPNAGWGHYLKLFLCTRGNLNIIDTSSDTSGYFLKLFLCERKSKIIDTSKSSEELVTVFGSLLRNVHVHNNCVAHWNQTPVLGIWLLQMQPIQAFNMPFTIVWLESQFLGKPFSSLEVREIDPFPLQVLTFEMSNTNSIKQLSACTHLNNIELQKTSGRILGT